MERQEKIDSRNRSHMPRRTPEQAADGGVVAVGLTVKPVGKPDAGPHVRRRGWRACVRTSLTCQADGLCHRISRNATPVGAKTETSPDAPAPYAGVTRVTRDDPGVRLAATSTRFRPSRFA
jgi:hypothetical protein